MLGVSFTLTLCNMIILVVVKPNIHMREADDKVCGGGDGDGAHDDIACNFTSFVLLVCVGINRCESSRSSSYHSRYDSSFNPAISEQGH